jgi:hypothetical protein
MTPLRLLRPSALFLAAAALASAAASARAQEAAPGSIGEAIGKIIEGVEIRAPQARPAEFVTRSRPATLDYQPLAPAGARKVDKAKNAQQAQALEKELTAAAAANRRRAARVKIPEAASHPPRAAN